MLLAYFAPEVAMPVASVVATVTGFVLAGGRPVISWMTRRLRGVRRVGARPDPGPAPVSPGRPGEPG